MEHSMFRRTLPSSIRIWPLHRATKCRSLCDVQHLVEGGALINETDYDGCTALHIAVHSKLTDIVKYLVEKGADVNATEVSRGRSPLHYATFNNDLELVRLLTESGANVQYSSTDVDIDMPILFAVEVGNIEIVKYYLENGIDVDVKLGKYKMTPLHIAASRGYIKLVDFLLLNNANVHLKDLQNRSSIHHAVISGKVKIVHDIIEKGVNINDGDIFKWTPLYIACRENYFEIVKLLFQNGAMSNLEERSRNRCPVHLATEMGRIEIIKYFISGGVDVNLGTTEECTLLHVAARFKQIEIVKYLLENGADVNKKIQGVTPLYVAVDSSCPNVTELLIQNGADLKLAECEGESILSLALEVVRAYRPRNHTVVVKVIIKYTVLIYNPIEQFIPDGCPFFEELTQYCKDCQKEITGMKNVIIKNSTISLYQIICDSNKHNAFIKYLCNDNIKNEIQNIEDCLKEFSIYSNINPLIQFNIKKGIQRMELFKDADLAMKKFVPKLPLEIRWKILDYLDLTEIKNVIQSDVF
ncbi:ankyrin-1-like [Diabrotica virgifera virgifera]|uniref:Ankyrin-1-like n=1 Tax=Diabrotica virgifera virgifera TaxID=50390 RepID=A0A6P7G5Q0_DIAVI|nr:ankyrin-1-like [Diabrotica virgifera virgifera]